jgi:hypothetical protein
MSNTNYGNAKHPKKEIDAIHSAVLKLQSGSGVNNVGVFSPSNSSETTTLTHPIIGENSLISLYPLSLNSAAVIGAFAEDRSSRTKGNAVIRHPKFATGSNFQFMFVVIG